MSGIAHGRAGAWTAWTSATIVVVMAAILFVQLRVVSEQNHVLMIENQKLEIQCEQLNDSLEEQGNRIIQRLDAGLPLTPELYNIHAVLKGPIIGALVRQIQDERFFVRYNGLRVLLALHIKGNRDPEFAPMVVPAVVDTLSDDRIRLLSLTILSGYGQNAASAASTVLETDKARNWNQIAVSVRTARQLDPQCDIVPLLIRFLLNQEKDWDITFTQMQHSFTDQEVLQAYAGALDQASDENQRRRYAGVVRYLKDRPPAGAFQPPRDVDEYIQEEGATKSE